MDVSRQFQKIRVILAYDGFVPILKQMSVSLVPTIKVNHIAREKLPHTLGKGLAPRPDQQMKMALHERPGIGHKKTFLA
jgi:hypothetical protein